jgi:hypothetical protein
MVKDGITRRASLAAIACGLLPLIPESSCASAAQQSDGIRVADFGARGDGRTDDTDAIQRAINYHRTLSSDERARRSILLEGTYLISRITITQDNNGLTFGHGRLVRNSGSGNGPNALVTVKQERASQTALEGIRVEHLECEGRAQYSSADLSDEADTAVNSANFQLCNGVEFVSEAAPAYRGIRNCHVNHLRGRRLGKSVVIFDEPESCSAKEVYATQCVGHAVGVSATSDHTLWPAGRQLSIEIENVEGQDTMTLLDLSAITDYRNRDRFLAYANVRGLQGRRIRGRSKIAGVWGVNLDGVNVDNEGVQFRAWGAIELAALEYTFLRISNVYARNMRGAIIGTAHSQATPLSFSNITAVSCNYGVGVTAKTVHISNLTTDDTYVPIGVSSENETIVVDGFAFRGISRESFVANPGRLPEYGIQSVPTKALTLQNGTIAGLGNANLPYDDIFIYIPPNASATLINIRNVRVTGPVARPFRHFLRNDSPNVRIRFEAFDVGLATFANYVIYNRASAATLSVSGGNIRSAMGIHDPRR